MISPADTTRYHLYTVSLWAEVTKVEGREGAFTGPSLAFMTASWSALLKSCNEVATARTSWALTFPGILLVFLRLA